MDNIDTIIMRLLGEDSRRSLADIGAVAGLSTSAVNERIKRLQARGAIRKFTIDADPAAMGLPVLVWFWIELPAGADEALFRRYAAEHPSIDECHHVTGPWSYLIKAHLASLQEAESFLTGMKQQGFLARSETIIALSTITSNPFSPKGEAV